MKSIKYKSFQVHTPEGLQELLESSPIHGFKITTHSKQGTYFLPRFIGWKTIETIEKVEYQEGTIWTQSLEVHLENTDLISITIFLRAYIAKALHTLNHNLNELPTQVGDDIYYDKIPQFFYQVLQVILLIDNLGLVPRESIQEYIAQLNNTANLFNSHREENDAIPVRLDSEEALDKKFFSSETYNLEFF